MLEFLRTRAGHALINHTLPKLAENIGRLADAISQSRAAGVTPELPSNNPYSLHDVIDQYGPITRSLDDGEHIVTERGNLTVNWLRVYPNADHQPMYQSDNTITW